MADWKKIEREYINSGTPYRELAKKYGVGLRTISTRATKGKWVEKKTEKQAERAAKLEIAKKEAKDAELVAGSGELTGTTAEKISLIANKLLTVVNEFLLDEAATPSNIRQLTGAIKDIRDIQGIKSDADTREQAARIAQLEKVAGTADAEDKVIIAEEGGILD